LVNKALKRIIAEAIEALPDASTAEIAKAITEKHGAELDAWNLANLIAAISRTIRRRERNQRAATPAQAWLPLPEFEHIPAEVQADSLEEYRQRIELLKRRIKFYLSARRSKEATKADKIELREMKRLEPKISRYFTKDPTMTVGRAVELYRANLETAASEQRQKASVIAIKKRWNRRTKNQ
jgi:hypothetical protein